MKYPTGDKQFNAAPMKSEQKKIYFAEEEIVNSLPTLGT